MSDEDGDKLELKFSLKRIAAYATALVAIGGAVTWALADVIKPVVDSDPLPVASIHRVEELAREMKVAQSQQQRDFGAVQRTLGTQGQAIDGLLRQNLVQTLQYWQSQQAIAMQTLKRNPHDAAAQSLLIVANKNIAELTTQLNGKL